MKRILLYIGVLFFGFSCIATDFRPAAGDLLFQIHESSDMTDAITASTAGKDSLKFDHVAISLGSERIDSVIEASAEGGVRIVPLHEFLAASTRFGGRPVVVVMRLRDTSGLAGRAAIRARRYLGQPYDYSYLPNNGRIYCSELVWESYLDSDGRRIFPAHPMHFRDSEGHLPQFWQELFAAQGEFVPEGIAGTNPSDLSKNQLLHEVYRYF